MKNFAPTHTHSSLRSSTNLAWLALFATAVATQSLAQPLDYSIGPSSPETWSLADIIMASGDDLRVPAADLGLSASDNVNAFSYGDAEVEPLADYNYVNLAYSVTRASVGRGGLVTRQSTLNGAAGDKLGVAFVRYGGRYIVLRKPYLISDAPTHNLTPNPGQSELDALSLYNQSGEFPNYFVYPPGSGADPATIYIVRSSGAAPEVFATPVNLNLVAGDVIDALAIGTTPFSLPRPQMLGPEVVIWVSLASGSPSRSIAESEGGDGILQVYPTGPSLVVDAISLDIGPEDEIDALTALDPGLREPGPQNVVTEQGLEVLDSNIVKLVEGGALRFEAAYGESLRGNTAHLNVRRIDESGNEIGTTRTVILNGAEGPIANVEPLAIASRRSSNPLYDAESLYGVKPSSGLINIGDRTGITVTPGRVRLLRFAVPKDSSESIYTGELLESDIFTESDWTNLVGMDFIPIGLMDPEDYIALYGTASDQTFGDGTTIPNEGIPPHDDANLVIGRFQTIEEQDVFTVDAYLKIDDAVANASTFRTRTEDGQNIVRSYTVARGALNDQNQRDWTYRYTVGGTIAVETFPVNPTASFALRKSALALTIADFNYSTREFNILGVIPIVSDNSDWIDVRAIEATDDAVVLGLNSQSSFVSLGVRFNLSDEDVASAAKLFAAFDNWQNPEIQATWSTDAPEGFVETIRDIELNEETGELQLILNSLRGDLAFGDTPVSFNFTNEETGESVPIHYFEDYGLESTIISLDWKTLSNARVILDTAAGERFPPLNSQNAFTTIDHLTGSFWYASGFTKAEGGSILPGNVDVPFSTDTPFFDQTYAYSYESGFRMPMNTATGDADLDGWDALAEDFHGTDSNRGDSHPSFEFRLNFDGSKSLFFNKARNTNVLAGLEYWQRESSKFTPLPEGFRLTGNGDSNVEEVVYDFGLIDPEELIIRFEYRPVLINDKIPF